MRSSCFFSLILYLFLSFQTILSIPISGIDIKPYHLLILFLSVISLYKYVLPRNLVFVYFYLFFVLFVSVFSYFFYEINYFYANYIFCLVVVICCSSVFSKSNYEDVLKGLKLASLIIIIISLANIVLNYDLVLQAHAMKVETGARPYLEFSIYGGGVNLEATWVALSSAFFIKDRKGFLIYSFLAFFISYAFMSRSGILACSFILLYWAIIKIRKLRYSKVFIFSLIPFLFFSLLSVFFVFSESPIVSRFVNIGSEPGSLGRLSMWKYVPSALYENPLIGYGAGNSIYSIRKFGFDGYEDNVHNYLIHNVLEFGLLGLLLWLCLCYIMIFKVKKTELNVYVACFFMLSLLQFRGAEAIFYFIVTVFAVSRIRVERYE